MSRLVFVRHGQASFLAEDYDQLSPTGSLQAERLGHYWRATPGASFDLVVHGPAKRHKQTGDIIADAFRQNGLTWPEPWEIPDFDEYQAFELMRQALPHLMERDADL